MANVERFKQKRVNVWIVRQKSGRCGEVTVRGGSTGIKESKKVRNERMQYSYRE